MTPSDGELLQAYVTRRSEAAFAALVERHIAAVYAVARRAAGQALAEDVTQAVFIVLARKAPALLEVRTLGGWLHRVTRFAAAEALRKNLRRTKHERRAAQGSVEAEIGSDEINVAAARIDEALALLATADREVLILRFYQEASFAEIGVALGISEEAARKRTHRALARMKKMLRRSAAMLAAIPLLIGSRLARAVPPAPPGLAQAVAAQAAGRAGLAGKTATLATGVQTMMLLQKLKMTVAALTLATVSVIAGWRVGVYVPASGIAAPAAGEPSQQSPGPQLDEGMLDQCFPVNCQPAPALPWNFWLETPATPQTEPPAKEDGAIDWRC
jgi:RNA polymerase sigma factor (sigma-70 family)